MCDEDTNDTILTPILHLESLIEPEHPLEEPTGHDPYNKAPDAADIHTGNAA